MKISPLQIHNLSTQQDYPQYKDYLRQINTANPFYRLEILLNPLVDPEGLKYFVFSTDDNPRILMLFYLRTIICPTTKVKFYDVISPYSYSGPIFNKNIEPNIITEFWNAVDFWYKENKVVSEFIRFSLNNNHRYYTGTAVNTLNNVKGLILSSEEQWENFDKKVRNNIRKAISYKLKFQLFHNSISQKSIAEFYQIYIKTLQRNKAEKRYYYSEEYFQNFVKNNRDACALAIVSKSQVAISVELLLLSDENVFSFLGGTNEEYFHTRPNDYLKFGVLNWAREKDFKSYILGGGQKNDDSLYKYKKAFFPKSDDVPFYTGRKIIDRDVYKMLVDGYCHVDKDEPQETYDISKGFFPSYRECENTQNM